MSGADTSGSASAAFRTRGQAWGTSTAFRTRGRTADGRASTAFRTRGQAWWRKGKRYQKDADAALEGKRCLQDTDAGFKAGLEVKDGERKEGDSPVSAVLRV